MIKVWIFLAIALITLAGIGVMQLIGGTDPMNSKGFGPGWECEVGKGRICLKDVKPPN